MRFPKKTVKKSITKKYLKNILAQYFKNNTEKAEEVENYIQNNRYEMTCFLCNKKCNKKHYPWAMEINNLPSIDKKTLRANKPFPKCIHCNNMARPNVSFFDDFIFLLAIIAVLS